MCLGIYMFAKGLLVGTVPSRREADDCRLVPRDGRTPIRAAGRGAGPGPCSHVLPVTAVTAVCLLRGGGGAVFSDKVQQTGSTSMCFGGRGGRFLPDLDTCQARDFTPANAVASCITRQWKQAGKPADSCCLCFSSPYCLVRSREITRATCQTCLRHINDMFCMFL